jgi:hypothetical protein
MAPDKKVTLPHTTRSLWPASGVDTTVVVLVLGTTKSHTRGRYSIVEGEYSRAMERVLGPEVCKYASKHTTPVHVDFCEGRAKARGERVLGDTRVAHDSQPPVHRTAAGLKVP